MTQVHAISGLDAQVHRPHALHAADRIWPETNCYTDLWIELSNALGLDPHAMLSFVFALDFEGDQWTFFKPQLADLRSLYGIEVQELTVWRPLLDHVVEHLGSGKLISVEVDSWWLPDTHGTDYRHAHGKTTIVANDIDTDAKRLGYFHNAGYFALEGEDFDATLALDREPAVLPPYAELIRIDRVVVKDPAALRALARELLASHLDWRPKDNPVDRFRGRFDEDLRKLQQAGLPLFHKWAFAGLRQLGAAADLAASYVRWQWPSNEPAEGVQAFREVAQLAKTLTLKSARAVNSGRSFDASETFEAMSRSWQTAMDATLSAASRG